MSVVHPRASLRSLATLAVVPILVVTGVTAAAVTGTPAPPGAVPAPDAGPAPLSLLQPAPRSIERIGDDLRVTTFAIDAAADVAASTVDAVRELLTEQGLRENPRPRPGLLTVHLLTPTAAAAEPAVVEPYGWEAADVAELGAEEYLLGSRAHRGRTASVALAGDGAGLYYAAQTLGQLAGLEPGVLPSVRIEDGPGFEFRGGLESFYGPDWSWPARRDQIDFLAALKMNVYFYGPANDPRTTGRAWRELYEPGQLAELERLAQYARGRHVEFIYRIGPAAPMHGGTAPGICHSRQSDRDALLARLEQLRGIGITRFVISWDDVTEQFTCPEDTARYGDLDQPVARAQADVLTDLDERFFSRHEELGTPITIPSLYWTNESTPYRSVFDENIPADWQIYWTGPAVMSPEIEPMDVAQVRAAFPRHELIIFDNYPVNDYDRGRLHLGPVVGRSPDLPGTVLGISWNQLSEQYASQVALATAADYAWNPAGYDPERAWDAVLTRFAGDRAGDFEIFADAHRYDGFHSDRMGPELGRILDTYLTAYRSGADLAGPAARLREHAAALARSGSLTEALPADLAAELGPWLEATSLGGQALLDALEVLTALAEGRDADAAAARDRMVGLRERMQAVRAVDPNGDTRAVHVAMGTLLPFLQRVESIAATPAGATLSAPYGERAIRGGGVSEVAIDVTARSAGSYRGRLTVIAPAGWVVTPASQDVEIESNGRPVTRRVEVEVAAPAGADPAHLRFAIDGDGDDAGFALGVYPADVTDSGDYAEIIAGDEPDSWWRLEEGDGTVIEDSVDGSGTGSTRGEVARGSAGAVPGSTGLELSGGYGEVPLDHVGSPTGELTVEAWVRTDRAASGDGIGVVEKYEGPAYNGFLLRLDGLSRPTFGLLDARSAAIVTGRTALGTGEWHHLVGTFDGTTMIVYADGVEVGRQQTSIRPGQSAISVKLGARGDDRARRLHGGLDEVALYDRALSATEVAAHFLAGR